MGKVNPTALVDWQDGQTVSSIDYKRERDLVVTANNDTHDRILTVTSIASTPAFIGQLAVFSGVGYIAVGTSASTDWKQITNV